MAGNISLERLLFDPSSASDGPLVGSYLVGQGGTVATITTDGALEQLDVHDKDAIALLTTIDSDIGDILTDTSAMVVDLAAIEVLLTSIDSDTGNILSDTNAMVVDIAAIEVLLTSIDSDTGNILTDTSAMVVDLAAIEVLLTSIDSDTSTIAGDTTSIDATLTALSKAEDSVHGSGDQGIMALAVRSDSEVALAADGDYHPLVVDEAGRLRVIADIDVTGLLPNTAINNEAISVGLTEVAIPASPLASRKLIQIQNNGDKSIFIGKTGVTTANGIEISKGGSVILEAGPNIALYAISSAAAQDVRILELS